MNDMYENITSASLKIHIKFTELATIFSSVDLADGPLTAITLSQKSKFDMTCWSPDCEEERDMLIEKVHI